MASLGYSEADSKKLEYGPRTISAGFPSCLGFEVGGASYSNFLASTAAELSSTGVAKKVQLNLSRREPHQM